MRVKATKLRQNIYKLLDKSLETGTPIKIERKGKILEIVPPKIQKKLEKLKPHDCMNDEAESYVHIDWSEEWKGI